MRFLEYYPVDFYNGVGNRCTIFFTYCPHACKGCHNKKSWNYEAKNSKLFDEEMQNRIINDLKDPFIFRHGLTLSGGDPLALRNAIELIPFLKRVKNECPDKNIWCWTGYKIEELLVNEIQKECLNYIDVLIDGKFEQEFYDPSLNWRGSSNQKIYELYKKNGLLIDFKDVTNN